MSEYIIINNYNFDKNVKKKKKRLTLEFYKCIFIKLTFTSKTTQLL